MHCLSPFNDTTITYSGKYNVIFSLVLACITSVVKFGHTLPKQGYGRPSEANFFGFASFLFFLHQLFRPTSVHGQLEPVTTN